MTAEHDLRRIAAFDVDGTLTRRDCVFPFVRRVAGTARLAVRLAQHPLELGGAAIQRDRDAFKTAGARAAFRGESAQRVRELADPFARDVYDRFLRDDVVASLREHQAAGHEVVLVSASFEVYLHPLAELLGIEHVLATRLVVGDDGRLTGALDGPNCRGPEKVRRLHGWLDASGGGRAGAHVSAYGDSSGDRELLLDADVPTWVGTGSVPSWITDR
ncbi:MAG: HAD-IB family hydrolase [Ilumatobacteraceae bacterium]